MKGLRFFSLALLFLASSMFAMESGLLHTNFSCIIPDCVTKVKNTIVVGSDKQIMLYDVLGTPLKKIEPPQGKEFGYQLISRENPDQFAVSYGNDEGVLLFDDAGQVVKNFSTDPDTPTEYGSVINFHPNGQELICRKPHAALGDETLFININSGEQAQRWQFAYDEQDPAGLLGLRYDDVDMYLARSFQAPTQQGITTFSIKEKHSRDANVQFAIDGARRLIVQQTTQNNQAAYYAMYDTADGKIVKKLPIGSNLDSLTYSSPDGRYFIETSDSTVKIFDWNACELKTTLSLPQGFWANDLWISEDNQELITASVPGCQDTIAGLKKAQDSVPKIKKLIRFATLAHLAKQRAERTSDQTGRIDIWQNFGLERPAPEEQSSSWLTSWLPRLW